MDKKPADPSAEAAAPAQSGESVEVLDWLETEVTAISCRYHGDPSYDHDAYWMRDRVVKLIADARKAFATPQPTQSEEPCGVAGSMPGTDGFTMVVFKASDVPVGTQVYTTPQPAQTPQVASQDDERAASPNLSLMQKLLGWNRAQANPPIRISMEYGVADFMLSALQNERAASPQATAMFPAALNPKLDKDKRDISTAQPATTTQPAQTERALTFEDRQQAVEAWEERIIADGRNISSREAACFEDGFEAGRALLTAAQPEIGADHE